MILVFESGRLGNQIIQYSGLRSHFPKHTIFASDWSALDETFSTSKVKFLNLTDIYLRKALRRAVMVLARLKLVGLVSENQSDQEHNLVIRLGLLKGIFVLRPGHFQHRGAFAPEEIDLKIRDSLLDEAKEWLRGNQQPMPQGCRVFVHIRRGDYLSWPSFSQPAALDADWYLSALDRLRRELSSPTFFLVSDDVDYLFRHFQSFSDCVIVGERTSLELAIMSQCDHGILSASSFAFAGACLSKIRQGFEKPAVFIAPLYWIGHPKKVWFPPGFCFSWIKYV